MDDKRDRDPVEPLRAVPPGEARRRASRGRNVAAGPVAIGHARPPRAGATRKRRRRSPSRAILGILQDGKPRRAAELFETLGRRRGVRSAAAYLAKIGAIDRVRHGVYIKAGAIAGEIPKREKIGRGLLRVYKCLETPRTLLELRMILGVTRQAVHKALMRLMEARKVKRALNRRGEYAYAQVGRRFDAALAGGAPVLRGAAVSILALLPANGEARPANVIGDSRRFRRALRRLQVLGLVASSGTNPSRRIRLTKRGREHPQYKLGATRRARR
jgi:hypothetical protein